MIRIKQLKFDTATMMVVTSTAVLNMAIGVAMTNTQYSGIMKEMLSVVGLWRMAMDTITKEGKW